MRILVTGAKGFVGRNLVVELKNRHFDEIYEYDRDTEPALLKEYCAKANFVFHLAGVNRPKEEDEFTKDNVEFTAILLDTLKNSHNTCPVLLASTIQAKLDNPYGISKREGEALLLQYRKETGADIFIYRFPNIFGKWCRPNYNSAIATFCYNIARDQEIIVKDTNIELRLVCIDDVINELIHALYNKVTRKGDYCEIEEVYSHTLGEVIRLITSFRKSRETCSIPDMKDAFTRKLYSTYLSYLPKEQLSYELKMNIDNRGSFTEFIRTPERGQISVNISKPGIVKGNHWHQAKNEKFLVVSGKGVISLRNINSEEVIDHYVSGDQLIVIDIPIGYTHRIENLGDSDLVTLIWVNECFNQDKPDTYYLEV